jgi:hypothetical protein
MDPRSDAFIGGQWLDVSPDVRGQEAVIGRGRADEQSRVTWTKVGLALNNRDGRYSNRNPTSPYYGLIGRNTLLRTRMRLLVDTFTRTTAAGGWGTADTGQVWTVTGGPAPEFSTDGSRGFMAIADSTTARQILNNTPVLNADVVATIQVGVLASGNTISAGLTARNAAGSYYLADMGLHTNQSVTLELWSATPASGLVSLGSVTVAGLTHTITTQFRLRFQVNGQQLRARVWDAATVEPTTWHIVRTSSAVTAAGGVGAYGFLWPVNTNTKPVTIAFDNVECNVHRSIGEVSQWPQRWDVTGRDVWVPLEVSGIMRRLTQGARKLKSPIYREATTATNLQYLIAYYPCTDGSSSTTAASGIGGPPMVASTGVSFAADSTSFPGSEPLAVCTAGGFTATLPPYTFTNTFAFRGLFTFGAGGLTDMAVLADTFGIGAVRRWAIRYRTGGGISLHAYDQADTELGTSGAVAFNANGKSLMVGFSATQNGANIDWAIFTREARADGSVGQVGLSGTFNALTLTPPNTLIIGNGGNLSSTTVGHFMIGTSVALASGVWSALTGNSGEKAATRMARVCAEEGVPFVLVGNASDTAAMGPQTTGTLLEIVNDCGDADAGIVFEPRETFGLGYRTRTSLYNQTGLSLNYAAAHLTPPLEPIDDDQGVHNDITASRPNGSSVRAFLGTGPLSILDVPNGIGTYEDPITVNVQTDAQLSDVAGWRLHTQAWDEARFPTVTVNLAAPAFVANPTLAAGAAGVDIGDYFSIANPPLWLPPDPIEQIAQGAQERLGKFRWQITWNASPAGPYRVVVLDGAGNLGRLDQPGSTLTTGVNTTATALSVTVPTGNPLWTTSITDVPFDIGVAGERIRVDAVGSVINANPWMIVDAAGWSGDGSTLAWSTAQQYNPAYGSLFVTPTAGGLPAYARSTARVAGTATLQYQIGAWIRASTAWASGFRLGVDWYTATVGGSYISTTFHSASVVLTANTWTYLSGVVTAPATAGGGQLFVVQSGTPAVTDVWYASGITYAFVGTINASPQGMTTTRSINGVVKSQLSGAAVDLWRPPVLAR